MASNETLAVNELFLSTDSCFFDVPVASRFADDTDSDHFKKPDKQMLDASNLLQEWNVHNLENDGNFGVCDLRRELLMRSFSTIEHIFHTWKSEPELPNSAETYIVAHVEQDERLISVSVSGSEEDALGSITNDFDLPLLISDLLDDIEDVTGPVAEGQLPLSDVLDELEDITTLLSEDDAPPDMVQYLKEDAASDEDLPLSSLIEGRAEQFGARLMLRLHREIQAVSLPLEDDLVSAISEALEYFESDHITEDDWNRSSDWFRSPPNGTDLPMLTELRSLERFCTECEGRTRLNGKLVAFYLKRLLKLVPGGLIPDGIKEAVTILLADSVYGATQPDREDLDLARRLLTVSPQRADILRGVRRICARILARDPVSPAQLAVVAVVHNPEGRHTLAQAIKFGWEPASLCNGAGVMEAPRRRRKFALPWHRRQAPSASPALATSPPSRPASVWSKLKDFAHSACKRVFPRKRTSSGDVARTPAAVLLFADDDSDLRAVSDDPKERAWLLQEADLWHD
ncbi:hypothetical protein HK405_007535, partial [Cladochytrium tenue]